MRFEIVLPWDVEDDFELTLVVSGNQQPHVADKRTGHPDTWTPAEGGELEDVDISFRNRHGDFPLPDSMKKKLRESEAFMAAVAHQIEADRRSNA